MTLYLAPVSLRSENMRWACTYEVNLNNAHQQRSTKTSELLKYEAHT